jgi:phage FluMu gp28-like protein
MNRLDNAAVFAATTLGIEPHAAQIRYLLNSAPTKVLVGGRRSGKTTAVAVETVFYAAKAIHHARRFRQLITAPSVDQSKVLFDAVRSLIESSPLGGLVESIVTSPFPEIHLARDGLVFVRAAHENGRLLRGHSAERVVVDEAAYVPDTVLIEAVGPILADSGGQLVLASTPTARGSHFHQQFERGRNGKDERVRSFTMNSTDNPHVDRAYIEAQRREMTEAQFRQEYLGEFSDAHDSIFRWDHIMAAASGQVEGAQSARRYVVGWDPALRRDRSGLAVLDVTSKPWRLVRLADLGRQDYVEQSSQVVGTAREFNGAKVMVDATGQSQVLVELLKREGVWCEGVTFTAATKAEMLQGLVVLFERHEIIIPSDRRLIDELRFYEATVGQAGRVKLGAPEGAKHHDDLVTALALAAWGAGGATRPLSPADVDLPPFLTSNSRYPVDALTSRPGDLPEDAWQPVDYW